MVNCHIYMSCTPQYLWFPAAASLISGCVFMLLLCCSAAAVSRLIHSTLVHHATGLQAILLHLSSLIGSIHTAVLLLGCSQGPVRGPVLGPSGPWVPGGGGSAQGGGGRTQEGNSQALSGTTTVGHTFGQGLVYHCASVSETTQNVMLESYPT
jgi:hypothetical protein